MTRFRKEIGCVFLALLAVLIGHVWPDVFSNPVAASGIFLAVGMLNEQILLPQNVPFSAVEQYIDLDHGLPCSELLFELTGTLTLTGGATGPTVRDDSLQRLIPRIRLIQGAPERVVVRDIPLRDMDGIWRRNIQSRGGVAIPAGALAAGSYPFRLMSGIPFCTSWDRRPWDGHLQPQTGDKAVLRLWILWEQAAHATATSTAGTGALVTGGDRVATFGVAPNLRVTQVCHPRINEKSGGWGAGRAYEQLTVANWTVASPRIEYALKSYRASDLHLFRIVHSATETVENTLTSLSLRASGFDWRNQQRFNDIRAQEAKYFPFVTEELGYFALLHAQGGNLTNMLEPRKHTNLRYEFEVAAPTGAPGQIILTQSQMLRDPRE